ncbi:MAG: asparagine synthetase B, partial [Deltaproteobacteria bacterium]
IREMARRMAFRGPDGLMVHGDGPVGFAHALLRTGESARLETGIASLGGRYWIAGDVRLDAREALGEGLGLDVWRLRATSDAELILRLYAARGEEGLASLVGDFAFALWDAQRQRLVCARDPFGVKPCFYASIGDAVVVSNTLACVLAHPDVDDDVDEGVIADFLITRENPALDKTFFHSVRRLPPAHRLHASKDSVRVERYWTLCAAPLRYRRGREYVEHFTELLRSAVSDRLPERGAAVSMSGGMDSSSVAAMAKEVLSARCVPKRGLFACTAVYERLIPDEEGRYAALVGEELGIPVHSFALDDHELFATLDRGPASAPEPLMDPLESEALLFDFAARRTRVMLTGQGGDPALRFDPFYLPGLLRRGRALRVASESLRHLFTFGRPPSVGARTIWRRRFRSGDPFAGYPDWLDPEFEKRRGLRTRWRACQQPTRGTEGGHATRPESRAMLLAPTWTNYFESVDPGITRTTVEVRHPFFDVRLLRFLLGIPAIPWCVNKELLRRAMRGRLPEAVRTRPKAPLAGDPPHAFPPRRFAMLAHRLRTAPELERFVRVDVLIERLAGRDAFGTLELDVVLPAVALGEWLRSRRGLATAVVRPARRGVAKQEWIHEYAQP